PPATHDAPGDKPATPASQLCDEAILVGGGCDKVDRKGPTRALSDQRDLLTQFGWRPTGGAEAAEASCIRDGGNQCVCGVDDTHAGLDDRMLDPEQLAESRPHHAASRVLRMPTA